MIFGGCGHDQIWVDDGNDTVRGGRGDNVLNGGDGVDMLRGGHGHDEDMDNDPLDHVFGMP